MRVSSMRLTSPVKIAHQLMCAGCTDPVVFSKGPERRAIQSASIVQVGYQHHYETSEAPGPLLLLEASERAEVFADFPDRISQICCAEESPPAF